jgi:DivIVA domain-containing protein
MTEDPRPLVASLGRLSPEEVRARTFATVRRGYDPAEVRALQEQVARELQAAAAREAELQRALADAERRAANPPVDEETLTAALGREAARLLQAARASAAEVVKEAEEKAAQIRQAAQREAEASAAEAKASAEALLARTREEARAMVQEAQELRNRVLADLQRRREQARAELARLRSGRQAVAQAVRAARTAAEEVLQNLEADPPALEAEAEPMPQESQGGATGPGGAERSAPRAGGPGPRRAQSQAERPDAAELRAADPSPAPPSPIDPEAAGSETAGSEAAARGAVAPETAAPETVGPEVVGPGTASDEAADAADPAARTDRGVGRLPQAEEPVFAPGGEDPAGVADEAADDTGVDGGATPRGAGGAEPAVGAGLRGRTRGGRPEVDALFARLRAGRQRRPGGVALAEDPAEPSPAPAVEPPGGEEPAVRLLQTGAVPRPRRAVGLASDGQPETEEPAGGGAAAATAEPPKEQPVETTTIEPAATEPPVAETATTETGGAPAGPGVAGDDLAILGQRDDLLRPLEQLLARRLKRCLQDDQNDVLDRLRHATGRAVRSEERPALLPALEEHLARYVEASRGPLREALVAGYGFQRSASDDSVHAERARFEHRAEEAARELAGALVASLRRRLLDEAESGEALPAPEDPEAAQGLAERIGAAFREWKGGRVEALAVDHLVAAFSAGQLEGAGTGTLRWVVDDDGGACADCDDNALAGPIGAGAPFPTGHARPPAHPGCRCLLVPASS